MSALLSWSIILALCAAIVIASPRAGIWTAALIMTVITVVTSPYVEQQLGIPGIQLAVVASVMLVGANWVRQVVSKKVNTAGRH